MSAMSPSFEGLALFKGCSVGLGSVIPPGHQSQVLKGCPLCGLHVPFCCGRAAAAAGHWWVGLLHSCEAQLRCSVDGALHGMCSQVITG